jgi:hypothetical protein
MLTVNDFCSLYVLSYAMRTKGEMLAHAIAFALSNAVKVVRGLRQGLTPENKYAVAQRAVEEMKKYGDPWRLNDEVKWEGPPPAQSWMPPRKE